MDDIAPTICCNLREAYRAHVTAASSSRLGFWTKTGWHFATKRRKIARVLSRRQIESRVRIAYFAARMRASFDSIEIAPASARMNCARAAYGWTSAR